MTRSIEASGNGKALSSTRALKFAACKGHSVAPCWAGIKAMTRSASERNGRRNGVEKPKPRTESPLTDGQTSRKRLRIKRAETWPRWLS